MLRLSMTYAFLIAALTFTSASAFARGSFFCTNGFQAVQGDDYGMTFTGMAYLGIQSGIRYSCSQRQSVNGILMSGVGYFCRTANHYALVSSFSTANGLLRNLQVLNPLGFPLTNLACTPR